MHIDISCTPPLAAMGDVLKDLQQNTLRDLKQFWQDTGGPLTATGTQQVFLTEGFGMWPKLSPRYAIEKRRLYPNQTILRRDDHYYGAATIAGAPGNLFRPSKTKMVWGVRLAFFKHRNLSWKAKRKRRKVPFPYPLAHEQGTRFMPARPVFSLLAQDSGFHRALEQGMVKHLERCIRLAVMRNMGAGP